MAAEDWMPTDWLSDWEYEECAGPFGYGFYSGAQPKTCRRCGKSGLYWSLSSGGNWVLPHECPAMVASASEFEDLTNVPNITPTSSAPTERRPVSRPGNSAATRKRSN